MRFIALALLVLTMGGFAGCGPFAQRDCSTYWVAGDALTCQEYRKLKADAEIRQETAKLLKAYRLCLQKHEADPAKAKENCSVYTQALHEIEVKYQRVK